MMWPILLTCFIILFLYYTLVTPLSYWKDRNVPYLKPWPLIGNALSILTRKESLTDFFETLYRTFPNERYIGIFSFRNPQLMVRDLNLIKLICVKDFDYFTNRTVQITEDVEPLFAKNLVSLQDQKWRDMRATLSPTFTSSKMRFMFNLISDCALQFVNNFRVENSRDVVEVDTKDVCTRFTNDAIASTAFGINLNSMDDKTNEFFMMGKDLTNFSGWRSLKFLGYSIFPRLMRLLKVTIFPKKFLDFFSDIIKGNIREREEKGLIRPDLIHIMLERRRGKGIKEDGGDLASTKEFANEAPSEGKRNAELTDEDIVAQALVFFFAGFETTSTLMCFMAHELAVNPDVQKKLQNEIDEALKRCNGKITYETLLSMKYLDMVISETLRMWPPGVAIERICGKDYIIHRDDGKSLTLKKGLSVAIPVYAIHRDPKYFGYPATFEPERFSDENKCIIEPFSYLPFGVGPRSCIASRFALMETKILFFHLLSKFDLVPTEKTTIPLVLTKKKFVLTPENGFWIGFRPRNT